MNLQDIIRKILEQRQDLTQNELLGLIEKKKTEAQGLLSDEGAARLVAQDLAVKIDGRALNEIRIANLVSNLGDVTLKGRVLAQWPLQEFRRQDGTAGKLVRLVLADKTGTIRCLLWNGKAEQLAGESLQGKIVRLEHAYTRVGWLGIVELNCGERSEITILPSDQQDQEYPDLSNFFKQLSDIKLNDGEVNVVGLIDSPPRITTFTKDQREGSVLRATIRDQEGTVNVVAWNDKAHELSELKKGDFLQIVGGRVKADPLGQPEVHVGGGSIASILREKPPHLKLRVQEHRSVSNIRPNNKDLTLLVKVVSIGNIREFARPSGQTSRYKALLVGDNTGLVRLFLWDEKVELVNTLHEGDILLIEGSQTREKGGEVFVSVGNSGNLIINPQTIDSVPGYPSKVLIGQLKDLSRPVIIEGLLVGDAELRTVQVGSGENIKVATLVLDDGSGRAQLSLWRELAERASGLRAGTKVRFVGMQPRPGIQGGLAMSSSNLTMMKILDSDGRVSGEGSLISHYV